MNFLTEEQALWRDTVYRFMEKEITREYVRECDMSRKYPVEGYRKLANAGWFSIIVPEELGGAGGSAMDYTVMVEGISRYGSDFAVTVMVPIFTANNIVKHGTKEQKDKYLGPLMEGDARFVISISEPEAGSDAANIKTSARRDGDGWRVKGVKLWNSGAGGGETTLCVIARTDPDSKRRDGLAMMLVPTSAEGVTVTPIKTMSRRATGCNTVYLDDVWLPDDALLGEAGDGWPMLVEHLELERIAAAACYLGCAQQAVDDALAHSLEREQFGQPIFDFQVIKHRLADMQTSVDAARLLVYRAAAMVDAGQPCAKEASMAKLFSSETLQTVSRNGMQILGGQSMLPEADMERYFREGMQSTIGGGTSEIQRTIIAQQMRKAG